MLVANCCPHIAGKPDLSVIYYRQIMTALPASNEQGLFVSEQGIISNGHQGTNPGLATYHF
jgi:hypothetical protein